MSGNGGGRKGGVQNGRPVRFRVFRFDALEGGAPRFAEYVVPAERGMTVLDGLYHILERHDPSLAFRSACRAAVCGSCAMHINGQYRLACRTQIASLGDTVTLRPLAHLPVLKDLVVDQEPFFAHYKAIRPYLIPKDPPPEKEYLQTEAERKRLDGVVDCLLCGACYGSCPVALSDPNYLGPHALLKALRFVADSRDGATRERLAFVASDEGIFRCHTIFNCQLVCPKDLDPTGAIARLKRAAIWDRLRGWFKG